MRAKPGTDARIDEKRWRALATRSPAASGSFLYGVRTTGVFCRPTCASRKPRKENVEFFESAEAALEAGYRPCKRCHPTDDACSEAVMEAMVEACRMLGSEERVQTRDIAATLGLSESYLQRSFKKHFGVTPQQYRRRVVAERARDVLGESRSVTESVYQSGYSSSSRFYEGVARELGMKPSVANDGGPGESISYYATECSLGHALIAWTSRGVCEVAFGDCPDVLPQQLHKHFPRARLKAADGHAWAKAVIDSVDMAIPAQVPIQVAGTAFQERVWQALRKIPVGETRVYSQVAEALGEPSAARAVAQACASNLLAVVVPCHRVLRKDGGLGGYRWGVDRKRELLIREQARMRETSQ